MSDKISFSLFENAFDFLKSAVDNVKDNTVNNRRLKYGILNLCDGIELLLKCRLNLEHWTLVLDDIDQTSQSKIDSGDFKSVSWNDAITRVEKVTEKPFEKKDKSLLDHLRKLRNRIQHFEISMTRDEATSLLAKGLHLAIAFAETHLHETEGVEDELQEIRIELASFDEFVNVRMQDISQELKKVAESTLVVDCPACRQESMYADGDRSQCLFCCYADAGEIMANVWVWEFGPYRSPKDEMITPSIEDCPECGRSAFVDVGGMTDSESGPEYLCFSCGSCGQCGRCVRCNGLFLLSGDDDMMCSDCGSRTAD